MGAPNPRPDRVTVTQNGNELVLYIKTAELTPFIGAQTPDPPAAGVAVTSTVKQHTRRRYPGDPGVTVTGHSRTRNDEKPLPKLTLPGNNAWIEYETTVGLETVTRSEQFTFTGSFTDLKDWVRSQAAQAFVLRSPWGEPFDVTPGP